MAKETRLGFVIRFADLEDMKRQAKREQRLASVADPKDTTTYAYWQAYQDACQQILQLGLYKGRKA